jgi:hypothetical protein
MDVWLARHTKTPTRRSFVTRLLLWASAFIVGTSALSAALMGLGMGMITVPITLIDALAGAPWTFLYWVHFPGTTVAMQFVAFSLSVLLNALILGLIMEAVHRYKGR